MFLFQSLVTVEFILSPTLPVGSMYKIGSSITAKPAETPPSLHWPSLVLINVPKFSLWESLPVSESNIK